MHPFAFQQKVAIITGAASGIGLGIAQALCESGVKVVMNDLNATSLTQLCQEWQQKGYHCHPVPGDAAETSTIDLLVQAAIQRYGRLDFCIPNAARTEFGSFWAFDEERFDQLMRLNLRGSFLLTQAAATQMKLQAQGGKILLLSSNIGQRPYPQLTAYSMSKAALEMMVQSLVLALSPHQITINALAPGATITERTLQDDPDYEAHWRSLVPMQRVARPADIAQSALFLLSPAANHITGHTLVVDGGWSQQGLFPPASPNAHLP